LIGDFRNFVLEAIRLTWVERSLGVVGVQQLSQEQPVQVVEVVLGVVSLTLASDALKLTTARIIFTVGCDIRSDTCFISSFPLSFTSTALGFI